MARYLLFNKPVNVLTSFTDPDWERGEIAERRATLADFVPVPGVYPAGRLDYDSEGLLFLTDDGDLAHRMTHPHFNHPKTYLVQVENVPDEAALDRLRRGGLAIKNYVSAPAEVRLLPAEPDLWPRDPPVRYRPAIPTAWLEMTLVEGKKRQVRRMTAAVGFPTLRLVRVAIGPLHLGDLPPGHWRDLGPAELSAARALLARRPRRRGQ
jgi:23S rRNA pseudouridine2457 synthase